MKKCLMLDVDGVLVTGRPIDGQPWATGIETDLGIDRGNLARMFFERHWSEIVRGRRELRNALGECLPGLAPGVSVDQFLNYWFENDSRIDETVLAQVTELRAGGFPVFLATNQEHLRARYLMEEMGLSRHVDGMIYSAMVASVKPDRAFYSACEERSGAAPAEVVLVDDSTANVAGAAKAGWAAFHWTGSGSLRDIISA